MRDAAGLGDAFRCLFFGPPLELLEVLGVTAGAGPTVRRVPACYDRGMGFIPLRLSSRFVLVFVLLFVAGAEAMPVTVAAAGDVACAASEPVAPDACQMAATDKLIEQADPDAVLALGDLQYPAGTLAYFLTSYYRTWGAFKTKTYPVPGNHEYGTPGAAGYYSYKWAEVLSADAFSAFEEAGLEDEQQIAQVGHRFRETVLALGGSQHPMQVFAAFRGREPNTRALLRHSGLAA